MSSQRSVSDTAASRSLRKGDQLLDDLERGDGKVAIAVHGALQGLGGPEAMGQTLVDLALERGGSDNITIVIAQAPVKRRSRPTSE